MNFQEAYNQAVEAANQAGDRFLNERPDYRDCCGYASIRFDDKRSKSYKDAKAAGLTFSNTVDFLHKYSGMQELTIKEVCIRAAIAKFQELGYGKMHLWAWMD